MTTRWKYEENGYTVVRTCAWSPPGCHPVGCGLRLYGKDGKLVKVEGDPEHPISQGRLCVRCLTLKDYMYHPQRIIYPMIRDGARGENRWKRISWDDAFDLIVKKAKEISNKYGPETIWPVIGTGRDVWHTLPMLTFAGFGSPNFLYPQSGLSCYGPRCAITVYIMGAGYPEIDYAAQFSDRYDNPNYRVPECILLWGKHPLESNPDGLYGHVFIDLLKRGTKLIVVDPRLTWLASKAEHWLQLRPGTDSALALGMLNVIINEELYDKEFVNKWCYGFEELKARVQEYPPDKVAEITWVPKEKIIAAARFFAKSKPASVCWGLAVDQKTTGVQTAHALIILGAVTGNIDNPGGIWLGDARGVCPPAWWGWDKLPDDMKAKRIGTEYPAFSTALSSMHTDLALDAMETGKPYPCKMAFFMAANPIAATDMAVPERWYRVFKKVDFTVVCDLFMTPTASAFADLFLPVATFAEKDGIVAPYYGSLQTFIGAINKAYQVGECKSDDEIMLELGKRLNPKNFPFANVEELLDWELRDTYGLNITFKELREQGWVFPPAVEYFKYEKGKQTLDGSLGFSTPTGKIELYSTLFEGWGEDPLPYYVEPPYSPYSTPEIAKEYPLILTTGGRTWPYFHSEGRQVPLLREIRPDPIVEIHPDTAEELGINDGDWVYIENMFGKCKMRAKLNPGIMTKVVQADHGWWFPEKPAEEPILSGVWESNINNLMPHNMIGKLGMGAPYKCMICKVYKA